MKCAVKLDLLNPTHDFISVFEGCDAMSDKPDDASTPDAKNYRPD